MLSSRPLTVRHNHSETVFFSFHSININHCRAVKGFKREAQLDWGRLKYSLCLCQTFPSHDQVLIYCKDLDRNRMISSGRSLERIKRIIHKQWIINTHTLKCFICSICQWRHDPMILLSVPPPDVVVCCERSQKSLETSTQSTDTVTWVLRRMGCNRFIILNI